MQPCRTVELQSRTIKQCWKRGNSIGCSNFPPGLAQDEFAWHLLLFRGSVVTQPQLLIHPPPTFILCIARRKTNQSRKNRPMKKRPWRILQNPEKNLIRSLKFLTNISRGINKEEINRYRSDQQIPRRKILPDRKMLRLWTAYANFPFLEMRNMKPKLGVMKEKLDCLMVRWRWCWWANIYGRIINGHLQVVVDTCSMLIGNYRQYLDFFQFEALSIYDRWQSLNFYTLYTKLR